MNSLSRNWSSIDETNFSDLIAEFSGDERSCLDKEAFDTATIVAT